MSHLDRGTTSSQQRIDTASLKSLNCEYSVVKDGIFVAFSLRYEVSEVSYDDHLPADLENSTK